MIIPEKTYSSNPFVDNIIYYAKLMALNCTVKDEEEALANETKESLYAGDLYIACIENRATYEMFQNVPAEILEKYISYSSNLDIYAKNPKNLKVHLNHYQPMVRNRIYKNLSSLARTVYIDHFDIMADYINEVGTQWLADYSLLYNKCRYGVATYEDLFDELPIQTVMRILKVYLNARGYCELVSIWDPQQITAKVLSDLAVEEARLSGNPIPMDSTVVLNTDYLLNESLYDNSISTYFNQFKIYINSRSDSAIYTELDRISQAMRDIFIDHYEIMRGRRYFSNDFYFKDATEYPEAYTHVSMSDEEFVELFSSGQIYKDSVVSNNAYIYAPGNGVEVDLDLVDPAWMGYYHNKDIYDKCKNGNITYYELYNLFPSGERYRVLVDVLGARDVEEYDLNGGDVEVLKIYLDNHTINSVSKKMSLNQKMINKYMTNYQSYFNRDIYFKCKAESLDIYDMYEYLPYETIKSILNTEIDLTTNIQVYAENKNMLNSYLASISYDEAQSIRDNITKDMMSWYPKNHVEKNNYYRALLGLPPMNSNGKVYEDTLVHSWDNVSNTFKNFGNKYTSQIGDNIYPPQHWKNEIYKFDSYDISILNENDILNSWVTYGCESSIYSNRYKYLRYIADQKLDLYTCRKAQNFALIGMPSVDDSDIYKKFVDAFGVNRDYIIRTVYSDAYNFNSDYYNNFIIIFILVNTIMDLLSGIPDLIIHREVFDARCIRYLFESYGVPYYSEIPIKYQQAMLKNLNILLKYKSSTKNMIDICSLFGFDDVKVFGYYLMKDRSIDPETKEYVFDENNDISYDINNLYVKDPEGEIIDLSGRKFSRLPDYRYYDENYYLKTITVINDDDTVTRKKIINNEIDNLFVYDSQLQQMVSLKATEYFTKINANTAPASLKFIQVPINENLAEYKNNEENIMGYDEITWEDTWDGGLDHDYLYNKLLEYEFNAVKTKYISVETLTDLTELSFQTSYFYNMLFDNLYSEELLTLKIPSLSQNHKFKLVDVIFYLFALTYYYYGIKDNIMYSPSQILYVKGYNFNEALNELVNDEHHFTQYDEYGKPLPDDDKENIFDINERIKEDGYDYLSVFDDPIYYVKGFNLNANIDELEKWVNDNFQISLNDLIVSTDVETFGNIVTLAQFYSLNNSYYQKDIFNGNMTPTEYNNTIKYAYDYEILEKVYIKDVSNISHSYIVEYDINTYGEDLYDFVSDIYAVVSKNDSLYTYNELLGLVKDSNTLDELETDAYILDDIYAVDSESDLQYIKSRIISLYYNEIINTSKYKNKLGETEEAIFILDANTYVIKNNTHTAIYNKYLKDTSGNYILDDSGYYINTSLDEYKLLFDGNILIVDENGKYIFMASNIYRIENNAYVDITNDPRFVYIDDNNNKVMLLGSHYYIEDPESGKLILDPENCYIYVLIDGQPQYILLKDIDEYTSILTDSDCYLKDSDGHFIRFDYTDYYVRTHVDDDYGNEMIYQSEDLYVISNTRTEYYDPSLSTNQRVYYKKIDNYFDTTYQSYKDTLYVKDKNGNYIKEEDILSPNNCYYLDEKTNKYVLVKDNLYLYQEYEYPRDVRYILVLQENFDYNRYTLDDSTGNYILDNLNNRKYIYNSDIDYITVLDGTKTYNDTNKLIVEFNKNIDDNITTYLSEDNTFNPSLHDNRWDENDWFYSGESSDQHIAINMHGENIWYYKDPSKNYDDNNPDIYSEEHIGSGFIIKWTEYINNIDLVPGEEYYFSMDVICGFNGTIQIYCEADNSVTNNEDRTYEIRTNESIHVSQTFIANNNTRPSICILRYNFDTNPINIGDYCVISNIKFIKSHSDGFIANNIPSYDQLLRLYQTNEVIYKYLITQMQNASDKDTYDLYKKLYDSLMVTKYNKEIFKMSNGQYAKSYTEFIQYRDEILYDKLKNYSLLDLEVMRRNISNEIVDIIYALDEVINTNGELKYIYSRFPGVSGSFVQNYIYKLINWFKSWKVHLLGVNTAYKMGKDGIIDANGNIVFSYNGNEFNIQILHDLDRKIRVDENQKDGFIYGEIKINPLDELNPAGIPYSEIFNFDEFTHVKDQDVGLRHRIRIMTRTENSITYEGDDKENMVIHLNDDSTKVSVRDTNKMTITTINGDEFSINNDKEMILTTDEDPQDVFASQIIDEINTLSGDYIEYDDLEDDDYE